MYSGITGVHPTSIFMMLAHILALVIVHDVHVRRPDLNYKAMFQCSRKKFFLK